MIAMSMALARYVKFEGLLESIPDPALVDEALNFLRAVRADIDHEVNESRLLIFADLRVLKGISYSYQTLTRKMKEGTFPQSIRLNDSGGIVWPEDVIDCWIASLPRGNATKPRKNNKVGA